MECPSFSHGASHLRYVMIVFGFAQWEIALPCILSCPWTVGFDHDIGASRDRSCAVVQGSKDSPTIGGLRTRGSGKPVFFPGLRKILQALDLLQVLTVSESSGDFPEPM